MEKLSSLRLLDGHIAYPHSQTLCYFKCLICQISFLPQFLHVEVEKNRRNEEGIHSFWIMVKINLSIVCKR